MTWLPLLSQIRLAARNRRIRLLPEIMGIVLFSGCGTGHHNTGGNAGPPSSLNPDSRRAAGPPPPSPAVVVISHGLRSKKKIALTFDACSTRKPSHYDERVTKVLVETGTPATIFLGGKWIEDEEEHVRYLASLPQFELGNHTYIHPHLTQVSDDDIREELERTQQQIFRVAGRKAAFFRPPYGEYDKRVATVASQVGLITLMYDLASGDPDIHATKEKLIEYVTSKARNGSIIVMHINRRGWQTAEALPDIISILHKRGFNFVTVGELVRDLEFRGQATQLRNSGLHYPP